MNVFKLMQELRKFPSNAEVQFAYDGKLRGDVEIVWLARDGTVGLKTADEGIYSQESWPVNGVQENVHGMPYWEGKVKDV